MIRGYRSVIWAEEMLLNERKHLNGSYLSLTFLSVSYCGFDPRILNLGTR
jgi:hypothetical protein